MGKATFRNFQYPAMGEKKVVWSRKLNIFFRHRYILNETLKEKIVSMYQLFLIPEPKNLTSNSWCDVCCPGSKKVTVKSWTFDESTCVAHSVNKLVLTKSYIRDSLAKSRFSMAWLQNLMRSRICVYLMFQWLKTILIWCISKTLVILIDYQTSIGFSQKSKFCYFLQISLPNSLMIYLQNKPKL